MKIEELQNFINEHKIPTVKGKPKTFLGIAKQPHYENVLSNIYAFYFNTNEEHKFKDLCIVSLLELISETAIGKEKQLSFQDDFEIETEHTTKKGGRIDLLLTSENEAIIIENKVYHKLNNNLADYWDSVKGLSKNKIGIVLSLHPIPKTGHKHFINITHLQLLNKVMEKIGTYILTSNDKFLVFLKDVYQNTTNLSKSYMEDKDLKFYFKNQQKINQISTFKSSVTEHIINEVEKVGNQLEGLKLYSPKISSDLGKRVRYFKSTIDENLMIVVVFNEMLTDKKELYLIVEFTNKLLKNRERYSKIEFDDDEQQVLAKDFYTNKNNSWAHFASKAYPVNEALIEDVSGFILKQLEEDKLLSIYNKLNNFLIEEKRVGKQSILIS